MTYGVPAAAIRLRDSSRISGCSSPSRASLAAGSAKTRSRILARSMAPDSAMNASPKSALMCGIAPPPACVSSWAMASVSTMAAPCVAKASAAALFPLPMPPVSPITSIRSDPAQPPAHDRLSPEQRHDAGNGEIRPEVKAEAAVPAAARREHLQRAEGEPDHRGEQDDQGQHVPAEQRSDRRVHLEVAVA